MVCLSLGQGSLVHNHHAAWGRHRWALVQAQSQTAQHRLEQTSGGYKGLPTVRTMALHKVQEFRDRDTFAGEKPLHLVTSD